MKVQLKKWTMNDLDSLVENCNKVDRQYLSDRIPYPYTKENGLWWLNMVDKEDGINGLYRAIVVDNKIVGTVSIEKKSNVYRIDGEIGYYLLADYYHQGIMSEAVRQFCELAFETLDIERISAQIYEPNKASRKVVEKNGFILEGIMKNAVIKNNKIYNLCIYGKTKSDG